MTRARRINERSSGVTALNHMLCWNPGTDQVALVPWPDHFGGPSERYGMTSLACYAHVEKMNFEQRKAYVFIEALHLIVRDRCDPLAVHRALLELDEYRDGCSADMPGAWQAREQRGEAQPDAFG